MASRTCDRSRGRKGERLIRVNGIIPETLPGTTASKMSWVNAVVGTTKDYCRCIKCPLSSILRSHYLGETVLKDAIFRVSKHQQPSLNPQTSNPQKP